ncbi:MAG: hypothetical protein K8F92_15660 [Hyphomicrobium sp.]|uniref:hypothetical protein n=1 Tax=Hyphomicrobium sp. TaxID=82 RepID=UPI0013280F24|nr:hypothetical protein [Hyphomicrobium sp.]KAB2938018.1 MAG: hypothetical protein F9K20_19385 [Hyphomicrobium sp.]MBZ0211067.1 hypothetical protein [Hyphomicrobium sp.]MCZ7594262.1 hypothetical protein [Hyphomicrobium sp.]
MSKSIERMVIERAIELLKQGWTDGPLAIDAKGRAVSPWSEKAVAWCAWGSLQRAALEVTGKVNLRLVDKIEAGFVKNVVRVNEFEGKSAVLRVMRKRLKML